MSIDTPVATFKIRIITQLIKHRIPSLGHRTYLTYRMLFDVDVLSIDRQCEQRQDNIKKSK